MRSRLLLLVSAVASFGCVHFPDAGLMQGTAAVELVRGPVVCGPVGFRKVPLQSRWGEYVRVTVTAPSKLRGTVLVHALGAAQEPRTFQAMGAGSLVVEARFPNEDPDVPFALDRERPIDVTIAGLAALEGGTCEGAVFTVEHGALVPSIDERAWIAELERRGGPALLARREARAQAEAQVRAQAAATAEAEAQVQLSVDAWAAAELKAQAEAASRELAAAEAQARADAAAAEVQAQAETMARAQAWARGQAQAQAQVNAAAEEEVAAQQQTQADAQTWAREQAQAQVNVAAEEEVAAQQQTQADAQAWAREQERARAELAMHAELAVQQQTQVSGGAACPPGEGSTVATGAVVVSGAASGCATCAADEWSQPYAPSTTWQQPYAARLDAAAGTTESRVAVGATADFAAIPAPPPPSVPVATATVHGEQAPVLWVPGLLNLVFSAAAALPPPPPPAHGARPAR